ncbi:MAG: GumC family protein [Candidatus Acidiferrales bacterium]
MTQTATKPQPEAAPHSVDAEVSPLAGPFGESCEWQVERLRLLWSHRRFLFLAAAGGLVVSTAAAFAIPKAYVSTTQLMPPDTQSNSGLAMMTALASEGSGGLGAMAGDLLGMKSTGALFIGVLRSQTSQDRLIQRFHLNKAYGKRLVTDARLKLDQNTSISEDRKSGIITISVTAESPERAQALADAYVDELNTLVAGLSTSSARRQRVFLEERLKVVKQDLDNASNQLAQFSSQNNTLDIQQEGKAMLDVAANLAGQMVAAQSEREGLRRIYTDNNPRVRAVTAQVEEYRRELAKLSGGNTAAEDSTDHLPGSTAGMPYPSIRNLPLLGVKYADYYRHAKIEETVYELLTQQYELAKVEEAKETPSVKVLDPANFPEKRSYPPRFVILFLGTSLALTSSVIWVLGSARWNEVDPQDPRKRLAREIAAALKASAPWASRIGGGPGSRGQEFWNRINRRPPTSGPAGRLN